MSIRLAALSILGISILAGCQRRTEQVTPEPPPPVPTTAEMRQRIQKIAPDAIVGEVVAVAPDARLVSVGGLPVKQFNKGDVLTFMGGEEQPIGAGVVTAIVGDHLHVRYDEPPAGERPPAVGDLAIRFKR